jgi:hypothetical protein
VLYREMLAALMSGIESHAVLHAGALVDRQGAALLLAAPSGHGKSCLTLELAGRGFGFLGDDYAPIDLATRRVAPYPRAVGIVPDADAPVPEALRERARASGSPRLAGKSLLDVGEVFGENVVRREPAPLRHVLLLTAHDATGPRPPFTLLDVSAPLDGADALVRRLDSTAGVEVVQRVDRAGSCYLRLRLDHDERPTAAVTAILDRPGVVTLDKRWELRPGFVAPPVATEVSRREAAEALGRELLNRRPGGRLLERYGGRLAALFLDLAGALRQAACHRISVGPCRETADLIEQLVER